MDLPDKLRHDAPPRFNEGIEDGPRVAFGKGCRDGSEERDEDGEDEKVVPFGHLDLADGEES